MPSAAVAPPRLRSRRLRWLARIAMALAGIVIGLVVAELAFRYRDGGAFPHLNVYVADPELGVRLAPGASQELAFGGNPITHVRINADGFRGGALPPPGEGEVLVVGDSQVFGLGVEEDQTFAARLQAALGRTVVNAGVPTYGPDEYRAVIAEQLARRRPRTVVLTINLVNDLFEAQHPNRERHAVWDGWAVRTETAPAAVTRFPGRDLLFRRSHLFFALRRWWHSGERNRIDERGFASEGTWQDLVATGERVRAARDTATASARTQDAALRKVEHDLARSEDELDRTIRDVLGDRPTFDPAVLRRARAHPGDIVEESSPFAESGRTIVVTAEYVRVAATQRAELRRQVEAWARARRGDGAQRALATLTTHDQLLAQLTELDARRVAAALDPPLAAHVRDVQRLVEGAGARLVVLILPIDVQVSTAEWEKYGAAPIDMAPTRALAAELVELCTGLGLTAVDATAPLAAAEPGAFLDRDIHMSPTGHAAVAAALAAALAGPPPVRPASAARSPVPVPAIWQQAPEVIVRGSTAAGCETKQVREWLRVLCTRRPGAAPPRTIVIDRDDGGDAMTLTMPHGVSLLVPVIPGRELAATITWPDRTRVLRVAWPAGAAAPTMAFDDPVATRQVSTPAAFVSAVERAICACWNQVHGGYVPRRDADVFECPGVYGTADPACAAAYPPGDDARCEQLLACVRRDPAAPP